MNICFVLFFNHHYDENLKKLDSIYQNKFSYIRYLMPFYSGLRKDVIPVYDSSEVFQGFFAQALPHIYDDRFTHYIFLADDLLLNPNINETNILDALGLDDDTAYIKGLESLADAHFQFWAHAVKGINVFTDFCYKNSFCHYQKELPSYEEAITRFERHGICNCTLTEKNFLMPEDAAAAKETLAEYRFHEQLCNRVLFASLQNTVKVQKEIPMPYPLAKGYSDLVIIPTTVVREFCRLCGVFAAMRLFAEIAIPTALLLSCKKYRNESHAGIKGCELWDYATRQGLVGQFQGRLDLLLDSLSNTNQLYLHPVKLTEWR